MFSTEEKLLKILMSSFLNKARENPKYTGPDNAVNMRKKLNMEDVPCSPSKWSSLIFTAASGKNETLIKKN
jgi:hypothetical protein